jgi:hypothetical protein
MLTKRPAHITLVCLIAVILYGISTLWEKIFLKICRKDTKQEVDDELFLITMQTRSYGASVATLTTCTQDVYLERAIFN